MAKTGQAIQVHSKQIVSGAVYNAHCTRTHQETTQADDIGLQ